VSADPGEIALLAALAFAGSLVFGVTGFGAALVIMPLATQFVALPFALALYCLMDLANSARIGLENPRRAVRAEWRRLAPMIVAGTAAGVTLLVNLPRRAGMAALGAFVVLYSIYALWPRRSGARISARWAWPAGFAGGITSAVFGAGGPPYVIYLSQRGLGKEEFRATLGLTTLTSISTRVVAFLATGLLSDLRVWLYALGVVPAAWLGLSLARRIYLAVSREALMRAVAVVLLASGASLLARALA